MKCQEIREQMLDLMTGEPLATEVRQHLDGCAACSAELASFQQTMALMDEWKAPEPTPFFDTRLQALLREEKAKAAQKRSWVLDWFRAPVLSAAAAVLLIVGSGIYTGFVNHAPQEKDKIIAQDPAIRDLQTLDKDQDVINNFAALDDDPSNDDQNTSTTE